MMRTYKTSDGKVHKIPDDATVVVGKRWSDVMERCSQCRRWKPKGVDCPGNHSKAVEPEG